MKEFIITTENEGQRFDKYLLRILNKANSSFIYKMLRKKNFVLNDKKATGKEILKCNDCIKLYIADDTYEKFKTDINCSIKYNSIKNSSVDNASSSKRIVNNNFSKQIIYEDRDIILINKKANILSQKSKVDDISVNELVLDYLVSGKKITQEQLINYKPSVINRLDRNTTGIIIVAKNLKAAQILSKSLKDRSIKKYYKCIVPDDFNVDGKYKAYLTKNNKSNTVQITKDLLSENSELIETEYKKLEFNGSVSLVEVHLITGKSHQIRAHLSYLGYPIVGDSKYGKNEINKQFKAKYQQLHAYKLIFPQYDDSFEFDFSGKTFICEPSFRY